MVFQKKGAKAVKNFTPNKKGKKQVEAEDDDSDMFNDMDDSDDFDDGSDEEMPVQKTPQNKTPKGRQSMSEKKVHFDMTKNTPGKTPNKNNNSVAKKAPTPAKGKGALQEFKGMKGGKPQQKKGGDDDDEDEDDDDEDDDDEEDDLDLDLEMGGDEDDEEEDDDEDEDDVDDEEDDDDDDDDEEEEEEQKPKQKQANNQKTPVKNENVKNQTPKAKTPKNEPVSPKKETSPQKNSETQKMEIQRRKERDSKMLYVGGLPKDVTSEEIQTLSPDIKNVILPRNKKTNTKFAFGFLCFASEAKAEANYKSLQSKKFRGQSLNIDFVGEKSKKKPTAPLEAKDTQINERKLYVTGIPVDATLADVAVHFPKAFQISFNKSPSFRSASINFDKIEDATEAFTTNKNAEVNGQKLIVVHSVVGAVKKPKNKRSRPQKKRFNNAKQGGTPAKKFKKESSGEE